MTADELLVYCLNNAPQIWVHTVSGRRSLAEMKATEALTWVVVWLRAGHIPIRVLDAPDSSAPSTCRVCGCTDARACVVDVDGEEGADLCYWVEPDLCSACVVEHPPPLLYGANGQPLRGSP